MERGMPVDLPLVWGEFWCPKFWSVDYCSKPFFPKNKKLISNSEV